MGGCREAPRSRAIPSTTGEAGRSEHTEERPSGARSQRGNAQLRTLVDLPSGQDDNAFGQGTKEDATAFTVVTGLIPPNKNDLTRSYVYNDRIGDNSFIYLAWERTAAIGDAHIDFELNQNATPGFDGSTTGQVMLNRTAGDILLAYDFGGSGTLTITLFTWDGRRGGNQQDLSALGSRRRW